MIETTFKEAHSEEWVKQNIADLTNELVIIRKIIPWESIVKQLSKFCILFKLNGKLIIA